MTIHTRSTTRPKNTTARKRRGFGAAAAVAALALGGALVPASGAMAGDAWTPENLQRICNGEPTGQTEGFEGSCTFEVQGEGPTYFKWLQYGSQVSNCNEGAVGTIDSQTGQVRSFSETWKSGGGVSLEIKDVLKIEGGAEYSQTRTTTNERRDTVHAPPGRKNALTQGTGFVDQTGRIRVDVNVYVTENDVTVSSGTEAHYIDDVSRTVPNGWTQVGQDDVLCSEDYRVPVN